MRAAFRCRHERQAVAVVVPTTLLARQHFRPSEERFSGLPLKVGHMSRFVASGALKETKDVVASGAVDIVVGTHAVLGKQITFKDLGLVIVDEEHISGLSIRSG